MTKEEIRKALIKRHEQVAWDWAARLPGDCRIEREDFEFDDKATTTLLTAYRKGEWARLRSSIVEQGDGDYTQRIEWDLHDIERLENA